MKQHARVEESVKASSSLSPHSNQNSVSLQDWTPQILFLPFCHLWEEKVGIIPSIHQALESRQGVLLSMEGSMSRLTAHHNEPNSGRLPQCSTVFRIDLTLHYVNNIL